MQRLCPLGRTSRGYDLPLSEEGCETGVFEMDITGECVLDWQTGGGTNDVMKLIECLERADIQWCAIDGIAVNYWAAEPMVTRDVDLVVATDAVERAVALFENAGFTIERFPWSINIKGTSKVVIQLSTEEFYRDFPERSIPADVHGILTRVASLHDTLRGKIRAWSDTQSRQSKKLKDLADIARMVESHPDLWDLLDEELRKIIQRPPSA